MKLHYFDHLMQRADSIEKSLMLGKIEGGGRRGRQRIRWLDGTLALLGWFLYYSLATAENVGFS